MHHEQLPFPAAVRRLLGLPDPEGYHRPPLALTPMKNDVPCTPTVLLPTMLLL
jgi:hypothetical protein